MEQSPSNTTLVNPDSPGPRAFGRTPRQSSRDEKIEAILHQATNNPTWTKGDLIAWAMRELGIAERTAKIYFYEAKRRYDALTPTVRS